MIPNQSLIHSKIIPKLPFCITIEKILKPVIIYIINFSETLITNHLLSLKPPLALRPNSPVLSIFGVFFKVYLSYRLIFRLDFIDIIIELVYKLPYKLLNITPKEYRNVFT